MQHSPMNRDFPWSAIRVEVGFKCELFEMNQCGKRPIRKICLCAGDPWERSHWLSPREISAQNRMRCTLGKTHSRLRKDQRSQPKIPKYITSIPRRRTCNRDWICTVYRTRARGNNDNGVPEIAGGWSSNWIDSQSCVISSSCFWLWNLSHIPSPRSPPTAFQTLGQLRCDNK
jgi:hypothetical protein